MTNCKKLMNIDNFDTEKKYKLYRTVYEILHPTISKRNISNYKIILGDELLPVRAFYPKKVSNISKVMLFICGNGSITKCYGKYSDICKELALESDHLVIAIDYDEFINKKYDILYEKIYEMIKYLYKELLECGISDENITLCGDSTGANLVVSVTRRGILENTFKVLKEILFYPTTSLEYFGKTKIESLLKDDSVSLELLGNLKNYYKKICYKKSDLNSEILCPLKIKKLDEFPRTLIFTGNVDVLKDEGFMYYEKFKNNSYVEIPFYGHGFLCKDDFDMKKEVYLQINKFYNE